MGLKGSFISAVNPKLTQLGHPFSLAFVIFIVNVVGFVQFFQYYSTQCQKQVLGYVPIDDFDARAGYFTNAGQSYPTVFVDKIAVWAHEGSGVTVMYTADGGIDPKSSFHDMAVDGEFTDGYSSDPAAHLGCQSKWVALNNAFAQGGFIKDYARFARQAMWGETVGTDPVRAKIVQQVLNHKSRGSASPFQGFYRDEYKKAVKAKIACTEKEQGLKAMSVEDYEDIWSMNYKLGAMVHVNLQASMECYKDTNWNDCLQMDYNSYSGGVTSPDGKGYSTESGRGHGPLTNSTLFTSIATMGTATYMTIDYRVCHPVGEVVSLTLAVLVYVESACTVLLIVLYMSFTSKGEGGALKKAREMADKEEECPGGDSAAAHKRIEALEKQVHMLLSASGVALSGSGPAVVPAGKLEQHLEVADSTEPTSTV
jgi:hypothetical protein